MIHPETYTPKQAENAMLYGVCLVCLTPQEIRKTVTEQCGHTHTHWALIRPCGHSESQIDAKLDEML